AWRPLGAGARGDGGGGGRSDWQNRRTLADQFREPDTARWYVPILNGALSFVLAFQSAVAPRGSAGAQLWPPGWLPAVVFALVLLADWQLRPVDVGELERLRYRYKGA
ncbi:MAG: hypothetical protein INR71_04600, partial [Terriglobus roseus]|nr:hypothetical protein [Terriglobus roseus]